MSMTNYHFVPYLREGLATAIEASPGTGETRTEIGVTLRTEARVKDTSTWEPHDFRQQVQLYGPGDILGFSKSIVTRTDPLNNSGNFEPNYFPCIEFSEPDFVWRFTPKIPDTNDFSLTPWITLIVLIDGTGNDGGGREYEEKTPSGDPFVPQIRISKDVLPDLSFAQQWAHVQVTGDEKTLDKASLIDVIRGEPERAVCRLMCPRRLRPKTKYTAFVVPSFRLGLVAADIIESNGDTADPLELAWTDDSPDKITLPYYYKWQFYTSVRGDFEYLVRLLKPRELSGLGTRDMDCGRPGYGITNFSIPGTEPPSSVTKLEGALQAFDTVYTPWGDDSSASPHDFQTELAHNLLNKPARDLGKLADNGGLNEGRFQYEAFNTSAIADINLEVLRNGKDIRFSWTTPVESTSRVDYGLTGEYGKFPESPVFGREHILTVEDLTPHKQYHFRISTIANDAAGTLSESADGTFKLPELPSVVPPIYGTWHRGQPFVNTEEKGKWLNTLNLDPRHRAAAGLGVRVIQQDQEALMASAWEQLGDIRRANKILRQAQVGRDTGRKTHERMSMMGLQQFLYFTDPVNGRVMMDNPCAEDVSNQPERMSVDQFIKKNTRIPDGVMTPAFRRIARVKGPTRKRQVKGGKKLRNDMLTRFVEGKLEPAGPHPRPGGMFTPCMISHVLERRAKELIPQQDLTQEYRIHLYWNAGGTASVSPRQDTYAAGSRVIIAALPNPGFHFVNWVGGPVGGVTNPVQQFIVNDNYAIHAVFLSDQDVIPDDDIVPGGGAAGTTPGGGVIGGTSIPGGPSGGGSRLTGRSRLETSGRGEIRVPADAASPLPMSRPLFGIIPGIVPPKPGLPSIKSGGEGTLFCEDHISSIDVLKHIARYEPFKGILNTPMNDTAEAANEALRNWLSRVQTDEKPPTHPEAILQTVRDTLGTALNPEKAVTERARRRIKVVGNAKVNADRGDQLDDILAAPEFPQPMYEPLRDLSENYLLPGVETVPQNTLGMLQTNRRFVESYMVGCNHEFSAELVWRRYPTDQRGTYFRQFWDVSEYIPGVGETNGDGTVKDDVKERLKDISPVTRWKDRALGHNASLPAGTDVDGGVAEDNDEDRDDIVLLVRGDLLKRYPNTVIYAVDTINTGTESKPVLRPALEDFLDGYRDSIPDPWFPVFRGTLSPDLTFFGFPFKEDKARGKDGGYGLYFIIEERVSEARFGLDMPGDNALSTWDDLSWKDVNLGDDDDVDKYIRGDLTIYPAPDITGDDAFTDAGRTWTQQDSSARRAWITLQRPVRMAIHSSKMLPPE